MTTTTSSSLDSLFNPDFYRANNTDLAGLNNQQALEHWKNFGIAEGRLFSPLINLNFYRASNPDLTSFNNVQLFDHLANFGLNEGRSFSPFVDLEFYQDSNPDLQSYGQPQLLQHLSNFGLNEGRAFSNFIDLNFYRASNSDLVTFNNQQLFNHLFQFGLNEGRVFSPYLDLNFYRASNSDLASLNNRQLLDHFSLYGLNEGRRFSSIPYNSSSGFGLVNAATAVAWASGQSPFAQVPDTSNWNLDRINAPEVWSRGYAGQGVVVAVIDSGVDYFHPDLDNNIWINSDEIPNNGRDDDNNGYIDDVQGWDFVYNDNTPIDLDGHGTQIAGIIAAENNGFGVTGVAFNAKIMPVKIMDIFLDEGASDYNTAAGIRYAADNGADVINLSLGGFSPIPETASAIKYAVEKGVVVVSASGNYDPEIEQLFERNQPMYPGLYATHFGITVGAVDSFNAIPWFSHRAGITPLDYVVAPGVDVYSTSVDPTFLSSTYELMDGTSFAAPHVAGVAALMLSANPNLSPVLVERILTASANSGSVRLFSASSVDSVTSNDDLNFQAQGVSGDDTSSSQMQTAMLQAMSGATPDGFYDLTFGNDNFRLTPGLLAGSPLGLRALDGNDTVEGSSVGEIIFGNQGDDYLGGNGGNDFVWGGKGADLVYGDDGNDTLNGNAEQDFVAGGAGNDLIRGGKDGDILMGEGGDDTLMGDLGVDVLIGGTGSDRFELRNSNFAEIIPQDADYILDFNRFSDRIGLPGFIAEADLMLTQENILMSSIGWTAQTRQEYLQLVGVDIDPNGDGIISGTSIAERNLLGSTLLTLGFVINVTPADLSGRFVYAGFSLL